MLLKGKSNISIQLICILTLTVLLIISLLFLTIFKGDATFKVAVIFSIISTVISFIIIFSNKGIANFGVFTALFIYFTLIHFGASTIYFISPGSVYERFKPHHYEWLNSNEVVLAILISIVAQIIYIFSGVFFAKRSRKINENNRVEPYEKSIWTPRIGYICVFIVFV